MVKFYFLVFSFFISVLFLESAYAATYDINMPSGSASPDAPFFWQNEKTGEATGNIEVNVGDTIVWKNGDQAKHTVTSGTVEGGPDGIFGSTDFLVPGELYKFTFLEKGSYPYFCLIHPWMTGVVTVVEEGYKLLPNVGKDVGDGTPVFNLDYQYTGTISDPSLNLEEKSINFKIKSDTKSPDQTLRIFFPPELIEGPYAIFLDGKKNLAFDYTQNAKTNMIKIEIPEESKEMKIVGTKIVPEFGIFTLFILGTSIFCMVVFTRSKFPLKP